MVLVEERAGCSESLPELSTPERAHFASRGHRAPSRCQGLEREALDS